MADYPRVMAWFSYIYLAEGIETEIGERCGQKAGLCFSPRSAEGRRSMSIRTIARAWETRPSIGIQILVQLAFVNPVDEESSCWLSLSSTAEKVRNIEYGMHKARRCILAGGWLPIKTGYGRKGCNQYTTDPEALSARAVTNTQMQQDTAFKLAGWVN